MYMPEDYHRSVNARTQVSSTAATRLTVSFNLTRGQQLAWSVSMRLVKSQFISLSLHVAAALFLVILGSRMAFHMVNPPNVIQRATRLLAPRLPRATGGGANVGDQPTRAGTPPPKSWKPFVYPHPQPNPKLPLYSSVAFDIPTVPLDSQPIGDPYSKFAGQSLGKHGPPGGLGDGGCCGGVGPGSGGPPGISSRAGRGSIVAAMLIHKVEPEFSEEARKAKYQGEVVLSIEIAIDGTPHILRVVSGPGLGLNEKAVEAVRQWRFKPAYRDGKPIHSTALVEVHFHLL
jgi:protein TonB